MGYSDRGNRSGGGRNRHTLHKAVCSNCGKECEVPFRPTGSKPVLCRDCFSLNDSRGSDRNNSRRYESRPSKGGREDRPMYEAVCDSCGKTCRIPFQPRSGKPVFCNNCFDTNGQTSRRSDNTQPVANYKEQFEALNAKMDKILELLNAADSKAIKTDATVEEMNAVSVLSESKNSVEPKKKPKTKATLAAKKKRESKKTSKKKK